MRDPIPYNSISFAFLSVFYIWEFRHFWANDSKGKVFTLYLLQVSLEKAMATQSSTLIWKVPWTEKPGGLQSTGSLSWTQLSDFTFTFHFHALEKEMATHSSVLAWRIPGTGEPGGLLYGVTQSRTWLKRLSSSSSKSHSLRWEA